MLCVSYHHKPYAIKQLRAGKSDVKDAEWIATCLRKDLIRGSYVPDATIGSCASTTAVYSTLTNTWFIYRTRWTRPCSVAIYVSATMCQTWIPNPTGKLLLRSQRGERAEELVKVIHGRTIKRCRRDTIVASLDGVVRQADIDLLKQYKEELDMLRRHKG